MGVGNMMGKVLQCQSEARARSRRGRMAGIISDGMLAWRSDVIMMMKKGTMMIILMIVMTTMTMTTNLINCKRFPLRSHLFHLAWSDL